MRDQFDNPVSCASQAAVRAYDRAVDFHLHAWPGVFEATSEALDEAPEFALPLALQALVLAGRGRGAEARDAIVRAEAKPHAQPRERSQIELIAAIVQGRVGDALTRVIEHARDYPTDALAASTALGAYGLFAFSGRADHNTARLAFTEALAPHYPADFAWLLAYRGWARIEIGRADEGLPLARRAIALRPTNGHNAHIVMHGYYETSQPEAALTFIAEWLPGYPDTALMWGHLQWHAALAQIEIGHIDEAQRLLLGAIADYLPRGTPFMGLADIISLPWRLGLLGKTGLPWAMAQQHAERHYPKGANVFGEMHLAMLAAVRRDRDALEAVQRRLGAIGDAGHEGAPIAIRWGQGLRALMDGDAIAARTHLDACCDSAARLGGSHAQRSVLDQTRQAMRIPDGPCN